MKNCFLFLLLSGINLIYAESSLNKIEYANKLYFSNPDSSFIICSSIEKENISKLELAEIYVCEARYFLLKTKYDKALDALNKASSIFKNKKNLSRLAKCHSLKNILFKRISEGEKALFYQRKALHIYSEINDVKGQINTLINIALDFIDEKQNDSTLYYLRKLEFFLPKMEESNKYYFYQNFASYYHNIGKYRLAIESYNKAITIADSLNMIDSKTTILMLLSKTFIASKKYGIAEMLLKESVTLAVENNLLLESNEAYVVLINLYETLGDYKQAFEYKKINDKIEKQIYNLEKINKINQYESELKLVEQDQLITQKELELKKEQLHAIQSDSKITQLFFLIIFSILIIIFVVIILLRTRKLNAKIQAQKIILEEKNNEITDSITYAKRIQTAILPNKETLKKHLPDSFVFYKPKDIVAGDFYWIQKINDTVLYAAADCTGHGVPGAMVSVVCSNSLNQSVKKLNTENPADLMNMTRYLVKESLNSTQEDVMDGMDIALCSLNTKTNKIQFSGANNPLYIVRDKELIEIKGDKQPVGRYLKEKPFSNHHYQLHKGDLIYVFTDGFQDQFGGPKGKKFMVKRMKKYFLSISHLPMQEQQKKISEVFADWKGNLEQVDDVCVIGVRV